MFASQYISNYGKQNQRAGDKEQQQQKKNVVKEIGSLLTLQDSWEVVHSFLPHMDQDKDLSQFLISADKSMLLVEDNENFSQIS